MKTRSASVAFTMMLFSFGLLSLNGEQIDGTMPGSSVRNSASINAAHYSSLQSAHDALPASGGRIYIPCGTYGRLTITKSNVEVFGSGDCAKIDLSNDKLGTPAIAVNGSNVRIHDLAIIGNRIAGGSSQAIRVGVAKMGAVHNVFVYRVTIRDTGGSSIVVQNASIIWIEDNTIISPKYSGIRLVGRVAGSVTHVWINRNFVRNPNLAADTGHSAIHADGDRMRRNVSNILIDGNTVEITDGHHTVGLQLNGIEHATIISNRVFGEHASAEGIAFTGNYVQVQNNEVSDSSGAAGILFFATAEGYHDVLIQGNASYNNTQGIALVWGQQNVTLTNVDVSGNLCSGDAFGIQAYRYTGVPNGSVQDVVIHNNHINGNRRAISLPKPDKGRWQETP